MGGRSGCRSSRRKDAAIDLAVTCPSHRRSRRSHSHHLHELTKAPRGHLPGGLFHDAALKQLEVQIATNDILDSRNAGILSTGTTILPLTIGLLALSKTEVSGVGYAFIAPLGVYVVLLLTSWRASLIRGLEFRPSLRSLRSTALSTSGRASSSGSARSTSRRSRRTRPCCVARHGGSGQRTPSCTSRASCSPSPPCYPYCELTSLGAGRGFGVRTMMFEGPGGGPSWRRPWLVFQPDPWFFTKDWLLAGVPLY